MNLKKFFGRIISSVTAAAMISTVAAVYRTDDKVVFETSAASSAVVNLSKTYQNIRGFGGIDLPEWQGYSLNDSELKRTFGNGSGELGLTVLRVYVNPDKNQWSKQLKTAQYAAKAGATLFATPWEPPSNLAEKGPAKGSTLNGVNVGEGGKLHLPKSNYGAYAQHLNDFGNYMKNNGAPLYSISVQNEPDYADQWTYWSPAETTDFIVNYGDKITSTRLMSPESFQYQAYTPGGRTFYTGILNNAKAFANTDVFGTHFYGTPRSKMDFPELENCGKEIWMTEVYVPNSDANSANRWPEAIQVAENIHNGLVVGNMSVYTWWYIKRSYGLLDQSNGSITKRGYMMAQYSKYIRPGYRRTEVTEQPQSNVLVSAYKGDNNKVVIVAVNNGSSELNQQFEISGQTITSAVRYRTSGSENLAETKMSPSGSGFNSQLPANSVSTYVCTIAGNHGVDGTDDSAPGITPVEPDSNGYFFHDEFEKSTCDWAGRGAATIMTSGRTFNKGAEALLIQERTASWNGAAKKLDTNPFKPGEAFSFSTCATYFDGPEVQTFYMKLQYVGSDGETHYDTIAEGKTNAGKWVQLENSNYKIPSDAVDAMIYVETADGTDNFYIDEAIGAVAGTKIQGPGQPEITIATEAPTEAPTVKPSESDKLYAGDATLDNVIDAFDIVAMRKAVSNKVFAGDNAKYTCDVNADGEVTVADLVLLQEYLLGKNTALKLPEISGGSVSVKMRTISEYTPIVEKQLANNETNESKQEKAGVNYGTVVSKSYYSNFCNREKKYNVLLPAGYSTAKKYPVLYALHGYYENPDRMILTGNGTMYTKQIFGNAIAEGAAEDMIVVFPDVFSSKTLQGCTGMNDENNQAYDNFETVLINELMPLIEKEYSVKTGRENTAITGFSMGGRESLNIGTKHADLFGYVGAICPAPGATPVTSFSSEDQAPSLIFITAGGNDEVVYTTPNGYHESFTKANTPHIWHYYQAGYHGDNSIHAHFYNFARAIFKA